MFDFCTCFDNNYILYGMTLYRSLERTGIDFRLFVACFDDLAFENLKRLNIRNLIPVRLSEIENWDPDFFAVKPTRNIVEYYFTMSPVLPLYLFDTVPGLDRIAYLDSDLYFFSSPDSLFQEAEPEATLIVRHDFSERCRADLKYGIYNVAFQVYRNSEEGLKILRTWRKQCLEWCYDRVEETRFADQKYLNNWPENYPSVRVLTKYAPAVLAPWNWSRHSITFEKNQLKSDGLPVVFYHYQDFKFITRDIVIPGNMKYLAGMSRKCSNFIYGTYYREILKTSEFLRARIGSERFSFSFRLKRYKDKQKTRHPFFSLPGNLCKGVKKLLSQEILFHGWRFY